MTATPPRLGTGTKLSYAVGNVGLQMLVAAMSFLLMIFYTDVALVPPAIAGAALTCPGRAGAKPGVRVGP